MSATTKLSAEQNGSAEIIAANVPRLLSAYLEIKLYHWNSRGEGFVSIHRILDEIADSLKELSDEMAERGVALGGTVQFDAIHFAGHLSIGSSPSVGDAIMKPSELLDSLAKRATNDIQNVDPVSADIFTRLSLAAAKYAWLIRANK